MTEDETSVVATLRAARAPRPHGPGPDLDGIVRAGAARRARRERRGAAAAAVLTAVLVGAVVGGVAVAPSVLGGAGGTVPVAGPGSAAAGRLALLARPAGPEDALPPAVADLHPLLAPVTVRLVADVDGVAYFAGTSAEGEVCVLVHARQPGATASSCLSPEDFEALGLGFGFSSSGGPDVRGVLVPDSWSFEEPDERVRAAVSPGSGLDLDDALTPNLLARVTGDG